MKQKYIAGKLGVSPANFSRLIASEKDSLRLMKAKEILNSIGYDIDLTIVPAGSQVNDIPSDGPDNPLLIDPAAPATASSVSSAPPEV